MVFEGGAENIDEISNAGSHHAHIFSDFGLGRNRISLTKTKTNFEILIGKIICVYAACFFIRKYDF